MGYDELKCKSFSVFGLGIAVFWMSSQLESSSSSQAIPFLSGPFRSELPSKAWKRKAPSSMLSDFLGLFFKKYSICSLSPCRKGLDTRLIRTDDRHRPALEMADGVESAALSVRDPLGTPLRQWNFDTIAFVYYNISNKEVWDA